MCTRFFFDKREVRPTDNAVVIVSSTENHRGYGPLQGIETEKKFGFPSGLSYDSKGVILNCRIETIGEKPLFKRAFKFSRCVVPANGYFEWNFKGEKCRITPERNGENIYFAGLYRPDMEKDCFVIVTAKAQGKMTQIHDRIPLILNEKEALQWLDCQNYRGEDIIANHSFEEEYKLSYSTEFEQLSFL